MEQKLELRIVTPERLVLSESVDELVLPSEDGYMGVRPGHASLMARLMVGEVSYTVEGRQHYMALSGGFAEVLRQRVRVLAETAEPADEIDLGRATGSRQRAEQRLKTELTESESRRAEVSLKRAVNRISVRGRVGV